MGFGMFGNECVGITWDGKRTLLDEMNEFGGFLTPDEAVDWATKHLVNYSQWSHLEMIEVYTHNKATNKLEVYATLRSEELLPDLDFSDKKQKQQ